ncbi:hypothetical protein Acr_18g0011950 [Actinidia rufa]|uniref:Uncharacterized protein n=1 Tax=Actinidia rufa TaxID=165716 RepID=A0A7J0G890_9ERIC|nr:hypothetical protein Acr_18g0011950 [Actinidia rufa]
MEKKSPTSSGGRVHLSPSLCSCFATARTVRFRRRVFDLGDGVFDLGNRGFDSSDEGFDSGDGVFDSGNRGFDSGDGMFDSGNRGFDSSDGGFDFTGTLSSLFGTRL